MRWACPLCGQPGKRSQEHVFAKGIADILGLTNESVQLHSAREGPLWGSRGLGVVVNVCRTCNNGWMSDLEAAFLASFGNALLGRAESFGGPALATFSHWSVKTALLLQLHIGGMGDATHLPSGHLRAVMSGVPPQTRVWMGAYAPRTRHTFWQGVPMMPATEAPLPQDSSTVGYATLLLVGHLVAVVLSLDASHGDDFEVEGLSPLVFLPVWPLPNEEVQWPGQRVV